jgi:hypothetical protein
VGRNSPAPAVRCVRASDPIPRKHWWQLNDRLKGRPWQAAGADRGPQE